MRGQVTPQIAKGRTVTLFKLFCFLSIFGILGCQNSPSKPQDTLVVAIGSIPSQLDPRYATDAESMKIGSLIFQSLVKIGPNMNIIGDAADTWTFKNLGSSYQLQFKLKPHLKFSNGMPITCEDFLFSFKEYKSKKSPFKSAFSNIIDVQCQGQNLDLTFNSYSEKVLNSDLPVVKILPQKIISRSKDTFKDLLIGSGAFKVQSFKEILIALEPNTYYSHPPKIQNVHFKVIKDDFTRFLKMYRGDLDLAVSSMPKNKVHSLEAVKRLKVIKRPGLKMAYMLLNFKNPILAKKENRQLLFQSLNRDEVIQYKLEGLAQKASSILPPTNPFFSPSLLSLNIFKPQAPEQLRKKVLSSDFSQHVLKLKTSNSREAVENAKLLTHQLRQLGFRIQHQSYEWGTYYTDIKEGRYDLATMTWVGAYDPDIYRIALSSKEFPPSGRNRGYYKNAIFDKLVEQGARELNLKKRKNIYNKVQEIAFEDLAILPLWYEDTITVIDQRVLNYQPSLNGDYSGIISAQLNN